VTAKQPSRLPAFLQKKIDILIMNYVISKARPVSTVDDTAFMAMVNGLNPKASAMGAKKLRKMIK